jgi:hypothetical protein
LQHAGGVEQIHSTNIAQVGSHLVAVLGANPYHDALAGVGVSRNEQFGRGNTGSNRSQPFSSFGP